MAARIRRLEAVFASRLETLAEGDLEVLVAGGISEDNDLEFKQIPYGTSDKAKRDLAVDVAAMANSVGGMILIGVRENDGLAVELTPVPLSEDEVLRMRQLVASNTAPVVDVEVVRIAAAEEGTGYYGLIVSPSTWAPHAVRLESSLRYARRTGTQNRLLSETEVADMYRDRFGASLRQRVRVEEIEREAVRQLAKASMIWATLSLMPNVPGSMPIDRQALHDVGAFVEAFNRGPGQGQFDAVEKTTGIRRIVMRSPHGIPLSTRSYCEMHADGGFFGALPAWNRGQRETPDRDEAPEGTPWIIDEHLVYPMVLLMKLAVEYATRFAGAAGDAVIRGSLFGYPSATSLSDDFQLPARLMHHRQMGIPMKRSNIGVWSRPVALHTIDLSAAAEDPEELLMAARLAVTDLFQAFGVPEVEQISADGQLRLMYFRGGTQPGSSVRSWADANDFTLSSSTLGEDSS